MLRRLDRLVWGWIDRYSDHVQRLAGLCVFAGVLLFARAAYAQTPGDLQRQIGAFARESAYGCVAPIAWAWPT